MTQFHSSGSEFSPALCHIKSLPWKLTAEHRVLRIPTSLLHFKASWFLAQVAVGQVGKRTSFVFVFVFVSVPVFVFSAHKWLMCWGEKELCSYFHCRQICLQLARPKAQGRRRRALISNRANFCAFSHFSPRPPESFSQKCNSVKSKHFCLMKGNNVLCWRHQGVFDSWFCLICKHTMFAQCRFSFNSTQSQLSYTLWNLQKPDGWRLDGKDDSMGP